MSGTSQVTLYDQHPMRPFFVSVYPYFSISYTHSSIVDNRKVTVGDYVFVNAPIEDPKYPWIAKVKSIDYNRLKVTVIWAYHPKDLPAKDKQTLGPFRDREILLSNWSDKISWGCLAGFAFVEENPKHRESAWWWAKCYNVKP